MDLLLWVGAGVALLWAIGKKSAITPSVSSTPGTSVTASPGSTAGYTSARAAAADGSLPGLPTSFVNDPSASSVGQAFLPAGGAAEAFNDPTQDTVIPGWLGTLIVGTIAPPVAPYMKVGGIDASLNAGAPQPTLTGQAGDTSALMIETYPGSGVFVPNPNYIPPDQKGPTDPNLDPNYTPADFVQGSQIAAGYLASNETATINPDTGQVVYGA